ncbi:zonular occludens toxin domain-containing protein [Vibrio vulnificus]|uniref:Assembly protein n=2 Tax=Vibrio vulnificus TaxID=672 RepID=A0A2S3R4U2_VIBVL|nr:zonular occludens toxin domain-containing protein [Vibrio vulnificus]POB48705.1 assembly protein [Vibrio vulnificus]
MALNILVGRPGSGKSYESVVYHVIPALKDGRKVVTNLPLNLEHFKQVFGDDVLELIDIREDKYNKENGVIKALSRPEDFTQEEWQNEQGQGPLFVIDECHFQFPKTGRGKQAQESLLDCLEYFSMHRHYGHDVLFMTQSLGKLNKDLRDMIEIQYIVSKHTAAGSQKSYTQKVMDGASGRPSCVNTKVRTYKKEFFPFYKSHTKSDKSVDEAHAKDIKPVWKHWSFYGAALCAIFVIYKLTQGNINPLSPAQAQSHTETQQQSTPQNKPLPVQQVVKAEEPKQKTHPFSKVNLHVSGWADAGYFDKQGKYVPDYRVYFTMSRNGQPLGDIKMRDLLLAGYDVSVLGECVVRIQYKATDYDDFVLCDTPAVSMGGIAETASL